MGRWLAWLEPILNRGDASFAARRAAGVVALCLYLAPVALVAWAATRLCVSAGALGFAALALLAASLPAQRSLARPRERGGRRTRRGSRRGPPRGREHRRSQSGRAGRGGRRARGDREPGGEFFRRRRCSDPMDRARRPRRRRALQGDQHRRQHDRPSGRTIQSLRLGRGAAGRPRQSAGVASCRAVAHSRPPCSPQAPRRGTRRAQYGATRRVIARPTPAGPKRRWLARSASSSPDRASMERRWSTTRSWGAADARPTLPTFGGRLGFIGGRAQFRRRPWPSHRWSGDDRGGAAISESVSSHFKGLPPI